MRYTEFQEAVFYPRMQKYLIACSGDTRKAMRPYRANIRLSQEIFAVLNLFEVVLRNKIDRHYKTTLGPDWINMAATAAGGFMQTPGCEKTLDSANKVILTLGAGYTHDSAVAEFTFGYWVYLYAAKQFMAAGSSLLATVPNRPFNTNHTAIYKKLTSINKIRNRIAHHEPLCFAGNPVHISTTYCIQKYNQIIELLTWMGYDSRTLLYGVDGVQKEINYINGI
jgi:hypothetical protein